MIVVFFAALLDAIVWLLGIVRTIFRFCWSFKDCDEPDDQNNKVDDREVSCELELLHVELLLEDLVDSVEDLVNPDSVLTSVGKLVLSEQDHSVVLLFKLLGVFVMIVE